MEELKCVIGTNSWGSRAYEKVVRGSYVEDSVIEEAVETALDNGLNVFDTADDYGFGYAQKLIGRFKETKDFRISAKYTPTGNYQPGQVHRAFEKQLRDAHHLAMAQVAIAYCISKGVIPVCGCRKPYQVQQFAEDVEASLQ